MPEEIIAYLNKLLFKMKNDLGLTQLERWLIDDLTDWWEEYGPR